MIPNNENSQDLDDIEKTENKDMHTMKMKLYNAFSSRLSHSKV